MVCATPRSRGGSIARWTPSRSGGEDSASDVLRGCGIQSAPAGRVASPPQQIALVKAVACEPPSVGAPLSRRSTADVHRLVVERGICAVSQSTIVRWLRRDAIRPWRYRSWIFPTDPDFAEKAGRVLDLYQGRWQGECLHPGDFVISADEKPSIQARRRIHQTLPPGPASDADSESSTPTGAAGRSPTSPPGMCAAAGSSAVQNPEAGSRRSTGSSGR